jgi:hypothetical protein
VLGPVGGCRADDDHGDRDDGDPPDPLEQPTRARARHQQPGDAREADQDHEPRPAGAGQQEPRCGEDDDQQVESPEPGGDIVVEPPLVDDEVDQEHDPGDDVHRHGEKAGLAAGQQDQRQERRQHQRERHRPVEPRQRPRILRRPRSPDSPLDGTIVHRLVPSRTGRTAWRTLVRTIVGQNMARQRPPGRAGNLTTVRGRTDTIWGRHLAGR